MAKWQEGGDRPRKRGRRSAPTGGRSPEAKPEPQRQSWKQGRTVRKPKKVWSGPWSQSGSLPSSRMGGGALVGLTLAFFALFLYAVYNQPRRPTVVAILPEPAQTQYTSQDVGVDRVRQYFASLREQQQVGPTVLNEATELRELAAESESGRQESALVVLVSGHGIVGFEDGELKPKVLLGDRRDAETQPQAISISELIGATEGRDTVLALDALRGRPRWEEGQLCHLLPVAARKALEGVKRNDVVIALPGGFGQHDWFLSPIEGARFAPAFLEGLAGGHNTKRLRLVDLFIWSTVESDSLIRGVSKAIRADAAQKGELLQTPIAHHRKASLFVGALSEAPEFAVVGFKELSNRQAPPWLAQSDAGQPPTRAPLATARVRFEWSECRLARATGDGLIPADDYKAKVKPLGPAIASLTRPRSVSSRPLGPTEQEAWDQIATANEIQRDELEPLLRGLPPSDSRPAEQHYAWLLHDFMSWDGAGPRAAAKALRLRDCSEKLAHWPDPRVHSIFRRRLAELEEKRRQCDDALFASDRQGMNAVGRDMDALLGEYEKLKADFQSVDNLFRDCDRVLADAPWMGQWWLDELQLAWFDTDATELGEEVVQRRSDEVLASLDRVAKKHAAALRASRGLHELAAQGLIGKKDPSARAALITQEAAYRPLANALPDFLNNVGEPPGENRLKIRWRLRASQNPLFGAGDTDWPALLTAIAEDQGAATQKDDPAGNWGRLYIKALHSAVVKGRHPITWMLGDDVVGKLDSIQSGGDWQSEYATWFAKLGGELREEIEDTCAKYVNLKSDPSITDSAAQPSLVKLAAASVEARRRAWLVGRRRSLSDLLASEDPFWLACLAGQKEWLAERACLDFWGNGDTDGAPYFVGLANAYAPGSRATAAAEDQAAEFAAVVETKAIGDPGAEQARFQQSLTVSAILPAGVANGTATLWQGDAPSSKRRVALEINRETHEETLTQDSFPGNQSLPLTVFYRGHVRRERVAPQRDTTIWRTVHHEPYPLGELKPQIRVEGDDVQMVDVVIVLDASYSMLLPDTAEGFSLSRMEAAKQEVGALLSKMQKAAEGQQDGQGYYRVSLVVYGHRSGWRKVRQPDGDDRVVGLKPGKLGPGWKDWPSLLHPNADVEVALEPEVLTADAPLEELLRSHLDPVKPLGATPLYLAVSKALKLLRQSNAKERHVIVLTDGENDVRTPGNLAREIVGYATDGVDFRLYNDLEGQDTILRQLREFRTDRPSILVIGYGDDGKTQRAQQEGRWKNSFGDLTDPTDVTVTVQPAADRTLLAKTLNAWFKSTLKTPRYEVSHLGGRVSLNRYGQVAALAEEPQPRWTASRQGEYRVTSSGLRYEVPPVLTRLDGWEDLELRLNTQQAEPWQLEFKPYEDSYSGTEFDQILNRPEGATTNTLYIGPQDAREEPWRILAVRCGGEVSTGRREFHVALERGSGAGQPILKQSVAPKYVWAEITPHNEDGPISDAVYYGLRHQVHQGAECPDP